MKMVSSVVVISPPTMTTPSPRCTSLPIPVANAAGSIPTVATLAVINMGRSRSPAPVSTARYKGIPCAPVQVRYHMIAFDSDTEQRMKPTEATLSVESVM